MSEIVRLSIRLNLEKDTDRQAWEYLQHMSHAEHKSINRAVISAVNEHFARKERMSHDSYLETREKEDAFLKRIEDTISQSMAAAAPLGGLLPLLQGVPAIPAASTPEDEESMDAALDFANSF